mgnify:CR=1 FL=1
MVEFEPPVAGGGRGMNLDRPEMRQDPVEGRWVLISPARANRPMPHDAPFLTDEGICPFCEGNETLTPPELLALRPSGGPANSKGWTVRIVPNRYPAVIPGQPEELGPGQLQAVGAHEVVVECPGHLPTMIPLGPGHMEAALGLARERVASLSTDPAHAWVQLFKNAGAAAGASLFHSHMQILSVPEVPHRVEALLQRAASQGDCPVCEQILWEKQKRIRIVAECDGLVAWCPFASGFPHEVWISPSAHQPHWEQMSDTLLGGLSRLLWEVLSGLEKSLGLFPHNLVMQGAPRFHPLACHGHWVLRVLPRLNGIAGFEWGTGMLINTVAPEVAAEMLRH